MINKMCLSCERFRRCCAGTECQVWDGCIWKIRKENTKEAVKNESLRKED